VGVGGGGVGVEVDVGAEAVASGGCGDGVEGAFADFGEGVDVVDVVVAVLDECVACFGDRGLDDHAGEGVAFEVEAEHSVVADATPQVSGAVWGVGVDAELAEPVGGLLATCLAGGVTV
jgi:hypothetical protein